MEIHEIDGHIQSIYLAVYPEKILLLDGCCRCDVELVRKYIEVKLKKPFSQLKLVIVTHMHPDHAGGAAIFHSQYGIPIASSAKEHHWYHGIRGAGYHLIDLSLAYWVAYKKGKATRNLWYKRTLQPDFLLAHHGKVPFFTDWLVLETPGHTDRDISILHPDTGTIYVADNILKIKSRFVSPFPVIYPEKYRLSLDLYQKINPNTVLMAHGGLEPFDRSILSEIYERLPEKSSYFKVLKSITRNFAKKLK